MFTFASKVTKKMQSAEIIINLTLVLCCRALMRVPYSTNQITIQDFAQVHGQT